MTGASWIGSAALARGSAGLVAIVGMMSALHAAPARACDPYVPFGQLVPSWEATGVPLNVEPILALAAVGSPGASLCEVAGDWDVGTLVPSDLQRLDATFTRLVPRALLRPETRYQVRSTSDCTGGELGRFITGATEDITAPDFAGVTAVVEDRYEAPWGNRCGPGSYNFYRLEMEAPIDADGGDANLMLLVYEGPSPDTVDLETPSMILESWKRQLTGKLSPDSRDDLAVVVTALDWAGNESAPQLPVMAQNKACGCQGPGAGGLAASALLLLPALARRRGAAADVPPREDAS